MKTLRFRFTLVEVLAVAALVSLLAAIGFGAYSYAMNASRESNTKALLKRIEAGLESCRTRYGFYPASYRPKDEDDPDTKPEDYPFNKIRFKLDSSTNLISAVEFCISEEDSSSKTELSDEMRKEFLRVVGEESLKKGKTGDFTLEDSWGGTIYYRYPGGFNKGGFDLVAPGADGKFGSGNETEPPTGRTSYYSTDNEKICDDITNF